MISKIYNDIKNIVVIISIIVPVIFILNLNSLDSNLFEIIITSLVAILTIIFTLSIFIISYVSDKYTAEIFKDYQKLMVNIFFKYIIIIIFIFLFSISNDYSSLFLILGACLSVFLFIYSFNFLIEFIEQIFKYTNPYEFAVIQKNKAIESIKNQEEKEIEQSIMVLGDMGVKSQERITFCVIKLLYNIFDKFIAFKEEEPGKYKTVHYYSASSGFMNFHDEYKDYEGIVVENIETVLKNNVLEYIMNEYLRIYKNSILKNQEFISNKIQYFVFKILTKSVNLKIEDERGNPDLSFFNQSKIKYNEFFNLAIENKSNSRFRLINLFLYLIKNLRNSPELPGSKINELINILYKMNLKIIEFNDLDLFKNEIYRIRNFPRVSTGTVPKYIRSPKEIIRINHYNVLGHGIDTNRTINHILTRYMKVIQKITTLNNRADLDHEQIELDFSIGIYKMFFALGGKLINENNNGFDSCIYIKELWNHPENPKSFDPFLLFNLYLFGCSDDLQWRIEYDIDDDSLIKYLLLNLSQSKKRNFLPKIDEIKNFIQDNEMDNLHYWYKFTFILDYKKERLLDNLNILTYNSNVWECVSSNERRNFLEDLRITEKWLFELFQNMKEIKNEIEKVSYLGISIFSKSIDFYDILTLSSSGRISYA